MSYRLFKTAETILIEHCDVLGHFRRARERFSFDTLFTSPDPFALIERLYETDSIATFFDPKLPILVPIESQEIWAAGVTYYRSRTARMEEAETAGGDIFYDKVYEAPRPELFFKATAAKARGHRERIGIRRDSTWDVPEPEFTLAINHLGKIFGHTIGNDVSSRSIEGENPLYLPQAKNYLGSCSLGPCLVVGPSPAPESSISISIVRDGSEVFTGATALSQIKRSFEELVSWLYRSNHFPQGAYLMTGTGIVPESDFTLQVDDEVAITIDGIGTLVNTVEEV